MTPGGALSGLGLTMELHLCRTGFSEQVQTTARRAFLRHEHKRVRRAVSLLAKKLLIYGWLCYCKLLVLWKLYIFCLVCTVTQSVRPPTRSNTVIERRLDERTADKAPLRRWLCYIVR